MAIAYPKDVAGNYNSINWRSNSLFDAGRPLLPMLHPLYFEPGSRARLPEVSEHLALNDDAFEVLGRFAGGMGMCLHLRHGATGQQLGLKSPRPEFVGDAKTSERFIEELRVWLAASACTGVAEALAVVRLNEMPAVVSRWLEGGDWTKAISDMPVQLCLVNLLRIVRTLDWVAANLGVIHRDLKPSNILLDSEQLAYVSDWGLAKPIDSTFKALKLGGARKYERLPNVAETEQGTIVGTILYAAPEQIFAGDHIDHRADIYSLGCIMFELEMGTPPFLGNDVIEIASQHLYDPVPRIGARTKLGIEKIIYRCLEKNPAARYQTHSELAEALEDAAQRQRIDLRKAAITTRYRRSVAGAGDPTVLPQNAVLSKDGRFAVVERDDVAPLFEEATNLMGLGRFRDAAKILERFYVPELASGSEWHLMHETGCNLAYCLSQIEDDQEKALRIFGQLASAGGKPVNFYINFALALLRAKRVADALDVCREGIQYYPDDLDLLGNLSIALLHTNQTSEAAEICLNRLSIRRDVHSLEESAVTLNTIATDLKWSDLPRAAKYAKLALQLATEGISLNPNYPSLFLARGRAYEFFNRTDLAAADYKAVNDMRSHHAFQGILLLRFVQMLETDREYESALSLIQKWSAHVISDDIRQDIEAVKMRIMFKQLMLDKTQGNYRAVVPEIVEFFRSAKAKDGRPKYPVDLAKVEDWIGRRSDAIAILKVILEAKHDDLDAIQSLAEILSNARDYEQAATWAKRLVEIAPWKAEAYDLAALVCGRAGNEEAAAGFKARGDEVFARESELLKL